MCLMGYMYISIHVHVAWIVLDTCTFGYFWIYMYFCIHVLLETCTLTFHLHVHVAWIVLDSFGYMYFLLLLDIYVLLDTFGYICIFGDMYIDISVINEWCISLLICSLVSTCSCVNILSLFVWIIYYLWMHYVKRTNYYI